MLSSLLNLVVKELRELLRDPKILIGVVVMPLILFPLLGSGMRVSQESVRESLQTASIGLLDYDSKNESHRLRTFITENSNITVVEIKAENIDEALNTIEDTNISSILVIPKGFSDNLTSGKNSELYTYSIIKGISLVETQKSGVVDYIINVFEYQAIIQSIQSAYPNRDPKEVLNPIKVSQLSVIKGVPLNVSPESLIGPIISQSTMLPLVIMMMLIFSMQIAATSMAIEKEEKTLETLFSLPVKRLSILAGKLIGSITVAIASAVSYTIGFGYYMSSVFADMPLGDLPLDLQSIGLTPSLLGYVLLLIVIFVTIVSALALAISLAVFTDSVRSSQSLLGFLMIPIIIPSIILMFADIDILPMILQVLMYLIPYTHTILAIKEVFMGNCLIVIRSIAYIAVFTAFILYVAARIFSTERVLTARMSLESLRLRRKKIK